MNKVFIFSQNEEYISKLSYHINQTINNVIIRNMNIVDYEVINDNLPCVIFSDEGFKYIFDELDQSQRNSYYFIVITENSSDENLKSLIDYGFDDYLIGIKNSSVIRNRLRKAVKFLDLNTKLESENRELRELAKKLESDYQNMLDLSIKFLESKIPYANQIIHNISDITIWIARHFDELSDDDFKELKLASYFSLSGKLFIPEQFSLTPVMNLGIPTNDFMYIVPAAAKKVISSISSFEKAGKIIYHIWENFDGSGFPNNLQKWQIPIESRILRVAIDFEENIFFKDLSVNESIENLKTNINKLYDQRIISLLEKYLETNIKTNFQEIAINLNDLKVGMTLTQDIITGADLKLIGKGNFISDRILELLLNHSKKDPILGPIYIDKSFFKNNTF